MKKHVLAAAVAAAIGTPALAQNVSIYGVLDQGYQSRKYENSDYTLANDGKFSSLGGTNQGSALTSQRLGFRGTEDLGGGLRANWIFELGFQDAQMINTTSESARIATIGLSGGFGSLNIGRDKSPSQLVMEAYTAGGANNWVGEALNYSDGRGFGAGGASSTTVDLRPVADFVADRANGLHYVSPAFNGFTLRAAAYDQTSSDNDGTLSANQSLKGTDVSLTFTGVPNLNVGVAFGERKDRASDAASPTKRTLAQVGAIYTLGPVGFYAQYFDAEKKSTTGSQDRQTNGWQAGIRYSMGAVVLHGQVNDSTEESAAGVKAADRKGYQVGAQYNLSKRTRLYALYGDQEAKNTTGTKQTVSGLAVGIAHSF